MTTETDIHDLMEGAAYTWCVNLQSAAGDSIDPALFAFYGVAQAPARAAVPISLVRVDGSTATLRMPGIYGADLPWRFQLFAQERTSRVEWLVDSGSVYLTPRLAGRQLTLDPAPSNITAILDANSHTVTTLIGENQTSIAENTAAALAARQAAQASAVSAQDAAGEANTHKEDAQAAQSAAESARSAAQSAQSGAESAKAGAESARSAAQSAQSGAESARSAAQSAQAAAESARSAAQSAQSGAESAKAGAETAKAGAQSAQAAAESAKADAQAAQSGAETAKADAVAAQSAAQSAQAAAEQAAQEARASAVAVGADQAELAESWANTARAAATDAQNAKEELLRMTSGAFYVQDESVPGGEYIDDEGLNFIFMLDDEHYGHAAEVYGVEWPAWPDLANSTGGPSVTVNNVPYGQHVPWSQTKATTPETYIHKLRDNAGLVAAFHRQGIDDGSAVDDYESRPLFMYRRCNYVHDRFGNRRVTAIEGTPKFQTSGEVDVGILARACWVKYEKTVSTDEERYPAANYATLYAEFGGVPVHRLFLSLQKPEGEEGWSYLPAAVRHDGSHAPYVIRTPYLSGWANGKLRSQPGLQAANNMSFSTLYTYYESSASTAYKGEGAHGSTLETWVWAWCMCMIKHGVKSSQSLCTGIDSLPIIYPALSPENGSRSLVVSSGDAATLVPGLQIAVRRTYNNGGTNTYDVVSGFGGSTEGWDSASRYVTPRKGVRVASRELRADGRYDIVLDSPVLDLAPVPLTRWAFTDSASGVVMSEYLEYDSSQSANPEKAFYRTIDLGDGRGNVKRYLRWVENPDFDPETGEEGSYFPLYSSWNSYRYANTLASTRGSATWNKYQFVPGMEQWAAYNRVYIQPAFPSGGITDVVAKHRDGCVGYHTRPWSPFRIAGLEFGQGIWEVCQDAVGLSHDDGEGTTRSYLYMAPKGGQGTRKADFSSIRANWVNMGEKMSNNEAWPAEFVFALGHGDTNFGTDAVPKYVTSAIFAAPRLQYPSPSGSSGGQSYGDYQWCANASGSAYELLLGGDYFTGVRCGLLCRFGSLALGLAYWFYGCRD